MISHFSSEADRQRDSLLRQQLAVHFCALPGSPIPCPGLALAGPGVDERSVPASGAARRVRRVLWVAWGVLSTFSLKGSQP